MIAPGRRKIIEFFVIFLVIYLVSVLFFYVMQRSFIYVPDRMRPVPALAGVPDMNFISVQTADGLTLQGLYKPPANEDKPVILMFHGNAGSTGIRAFKARPFLNFGYGFLLAEYRAYGGNGGTISEEGLYNDARAYIKWLGENGVLPGRVVLYGESLGTGVAVQMAVEYPGVRAVMLEAPYTALWKVAQRHMFMLPSCILMKDRFESIKKIKNVTAPLLIINGSLDNIVPPAMGQSLYEAANEPKTIQVYPFAGHNDLYTHGAAGAMLKFLEYLDKP